ncbi:MAG TPA: SDR family oxidoreductase [Myxococcales bacterium]|jgi:NAD(P)-dependent dehydrogenase (short-subunit alcohol dehydrogenase family)|nr:SDR family oxidoreductase [Myxococcales bacterium]
MSTSRSAVVTGASTGIGLGTARVLIRHGVQVFGSVRKSADAERLRQELGERFTPLLFDVTDHAAVRRAADEVGATLAGSKLFGLVNNAGVAVGGPVLELTADELRRQMEVNLVGPLVVTQAFAPLLGADRSRSGPPGRIVNVSSVGGKMGAPFLGAYVASKHALEGLSESLRREMMLYGIDVIIVAPGTVATPIWDKAEQEDVSRYENSDFRQALTTFRNFLIKEGPTGFPPERIGEAIWTALSARRPKVRYAVVPQRFTKWTLPTTLPARLVDRLVARAVGLTPGPP